MRSSRAGSHAITADCGRRLATTLNMTLTSAPRGVSSGYVVLMFFLVFAFLVVRWQFSPGRRRTLPASGRLSS